MNCKILKNVKFNGKYFSAGEESTFPEDKVVKGLIADGVLEPVKEPEPEITGKNPEKKEEKSKKK